MSRVSRAMLAIGLLLSGLAVVAARADAGTLAESFAETTYASGIEYATAMDFAPDGRLFVASQDGVVRIVTDESTAPTTFLTISTDAEGERGLTGLTLDPDFQHHPYVYVYYAIKDPDSGSVHNRVSRFRADGDVAESVDGVPVEQVLIDLEPLGHHSHVSGALDIGGDGKLYIATGDNKVPEQAQSLDNTFGKILRINTDGSIPPENPYAATATGVSRAIWARGFRNPFTFDVSASGRTFVNDVGEDAWEEIDELAKGSNYGWPTAEGPSADPQLTSPHYAYPHDFAPVSGCAITGGTFFEPASTGYPKELLGSYFFADFCSGWIKRLDPDTKRVTDFAADLANPVDLDVGPDGDLYYLSRTAGTVTRIRYTGDHQEPTAAITSPTIGSTYAGGQTISYSGTARNAQGSALPASAYTWSIDLHQEGSTQQVMAPKTGVVSGSFVVPQSGPTDSNVFYRLNLGVVDAQGRHSTAYVDLVPRKVTLTLATSVPGLGGVTLDGTQQTPPSTTTSVVGVKRTLGVLSPQTLDGKTYQFVSWSDGGAASHSVTTPTTDTAYTATFKEQPPPPPTVLKVTPTADSYANAGAKGTNYGTSASLCARGATAAPAVSYLRFTLPPAPAGKTLTGASLRIRTTTLSSAGSKATQTVALADNTWTEGGLTWSNKPAVRAAVGTVPANTVPNTSYATTLKASELAGKLGTTVSLALVGNGDDNLWLWSRNHSSASYRPELTLTYS